MNSIDSLKHVLIIFMCIGGPVYKVSAVVTIGFQLFGDIVPSKITQGDQQLHAILESKGEPQFCSFSRVSQ